jgi:small subunit ribosomal protein S18
MPAPKRSRRPKPDRVKRKRFTDEDLARISYRDPEYLRTFLSGRGKIKSRRQTGLPRKWQTRLAREVKRAREMALLPYAAEPEKGERPERSGRGRRDRDDD